MSHLIFVLIWSVICAAWAFGVAELKNRNGTAVAVLALLFGLVGVIAAYLQDEAPDRVR